MHWKIKASLQRVLALTHFGDTLNHIPATRNKEYHANVFRYQFSECLRKFNHTSIQLKKKRRTALEIGTGYSIVAPIILHLLGFDNIITVDITEDISIKTFKKQFKEIDKQEFLDLVNKNSIYNSEQIQQKIQNIKSCRTLEALLTTCHVTYIPQYKIEDIPQHADQVDYIYSQVVFEHVPPDQLNRLFEYSKKALAKDGWAVHTINFIDHFANPGFFQDKNISEFNFLQYSNQYWNQWAGNDIAYTNRLSYLYYIDLCKKHDLDLVAFHGKNYRASHPIDPSKIHDDVLKNYRIPPDPKELQKYQRGTIVMKQKESNH